MKKILIIVLIILLSILLYNAVTKDITIGSIEILSFESIKQENKNLNNKMEEVNRLTSLNYPEKYSSLIAAGKELEKVKEEYQNRIKYMSEENINQINELDKYNIEFFWYNIGNYVTKHNVNQTIDILSTAVDGIYDINFTLVGGYINIADVLYAIEKDDRFNFKIEDFKIVPNSTTDIKGISDNTFILQATFTIRNVPVDNFNLNTPLIQTNEATNEIQDETVDEVTQRTNKVTRSNENVVQQ